MADQFSAPFQENLLTLVCFSDDYAGTIRKCVPLHYFDFILHPVAKKAYEFIDRFGEPPKEHISDLLEAEMEEDELLEGLLKQLFQSQESVNPKYVVSKLETFLRNQELRAAIVEASNVLLGEEDQETALDKAEALLNKASKHTLQLFDPGSKLEDVDEVYEWMNQRYNNFKLYIDALDKRSATPMRGGLLLYVAPTKTGKSQFMVHVGRSALLQRLNVVHITLEMSAAQVKQRYYQSLFGMTKYDQTMEVPRFIKNPGTGLGDEELLNIEFDFLRPQKTFNDEESRDWLVEKLEHFHAKQHLIVKQFPPGELTVDGLNVYLDDLEKVHQFVPDIVILDYVDDMKTRAEYLRIDLGILMKGIRAIAVNRNCAMVSASQTNREGAKKKWVSGTDVAEDWSKIFTADVIITYSQTEVEHEMNLARLWVPHSRGDQDRFGVLISQNYAMAQFCVDSCLLNKQAGEVLKRVTDIDVSDSGDFF